MSITVRTSQPVRIAILVGSLMGVVPAWSSEVPARTVSGRPDFSGTYDVATLTPLVRPRALGTKLALTDAEAERMARGAQARDIASSQDSDPDREAPPEGGNVGGYNAFWIDAGSSAFKIDGQWRTSILVDPPDGQMPPMTEHGEALRRERLALWGRAESGFGGPADRADAWWIEQGTGPYDSVQVRPLGERCLLGFGSPAGPPVLPVLYNNLKTVVQTDDYLMILSEMVHDARIIRIDGRHGDASIARWLGDSVGHWEGDTLVVETVGFRPAESPLSAPFFSFSLVTSDQLRVTERFRRDDAGSLVYGFTVEDPVTWAGSWSGEYPWPETDTKLYEYACHEGNYSLGNILRGARLAEQDLETGRSVN